MTACTKANDGKITKKHKKKNKKKKNKNKKNWVFAKQRSLLRVIEIVDLL